MEIAMGINIQGRTVGVLNDPRIGHKVIGNSSDFAWSVQECFFVTVEVRHPAEFVAEDLRFHTRDGADSFLLSSEAVFFFICQVLCLQNY